MLAGLLVGWLPDVESLECWGKVIVITVKGASCQKYWGKSAFSVTYFTFQIACSGPVAAVASHETEYSYSLVIAGMLDFIYLRRR